VTQFAYAHIDTANGPGGYCAGCRHCRFRVKLPRELGVPAWGKLAKVRSAVIQHIKAEHPEVYAEALAAYRSHQAWYKQRKAEHWA
jgi:hypothetical protein